MAEIDVLINTIDSGFGIGEGVLTVESIPIVPETGYSTAVESAFCIANSLVVINYRLNVSSGQMAQNAYTTVARIPIKFAPKIDVLTGAGTIGGNVAFAFVASDGRIQINQRTGRTDLGWFAFSIAYMI